VYGHGAWFHHRRFFLASQIRLAHVFSPRGFDLLSQVKLWMTTPPTPPNSRRTRGWVCPSVGNVHPTPRGYASADTCKLGGNRGVDAAHPPHKSLRPARLGIPLAGGRCIRGYTGEPRRRHRRAVSCLIVRPAMQQLRDELPTAKSSHRHACFSRRNAVLHSIKM
jgi:hypothetical protein